MATQKDNKSIISKLFKLLYYIVIAFVCLITFFLIYYIVVSQIHANDEDYKPGVSIYTIVSPSMTPVIKVYDVVVNVKTSSPKDIQIGDIITYKSVASTSEGMTITHRVVNIDQLPDGTYEYMTQGDNNSEPDSSYVAYDQIIGKEIFIIPQLGKLQFLIATQKGWLFLLLIPIGIYLLRELFKLFDLFGLRKRVNRIVGTPEEPTTDEDIEDINRRKEKIRTELKAKESIKDSRVKNALEPASFLEEYNETTVSVANNRYIKPSKAVTPVEEPIEELELPTKKEIPKVETLEIEVKEEKPVVKETPKVVIEPPKVEKEKKEDKKEEKVVLPKPKAIEIEDEYETLDTDDLTTKIKEYDSKIEKLDKMIKDMETISTAKQASKPEEKAFVESNDYLKGSKIKVSKVVETKNQKRQVTPRKTRTVKAPVDNNIKIELKPVIPNLKNDRLKVERPVSEDINVVRAKEVKKETKAPVLIEQDTRPIPTPIPVEPVKKYSTQVKQPVIENRKDEIKIQVQPKVEEIKVEKKQATKKNKKLNLNPKEIKKINRGIKKNNTGTKSKKRLNLNPKEVKKINRDTTKKKNKKTYSPLPKEPLIYIEKIK